MKSLIVKLFENKEHPTRKQLLRKLKKLDDNNSDIVSTTKAEWLQKNKPDEIIEALNNLRKSTKSKNKNQPENKQRASITQIMLGRSGNTPQT